MQLKGVDVAGGGDLGVGRAGVLDTSVHDEVASVHEGERVPGARLWYCALLGGL